MTDYGEYTLNTTEARTWTFNIDDLGAIELDAPQQAKAEVANAKDVKYRNLRARLINNRQRGDTYVTVIEVFKHD
jgi:hypothetical protein